MTSTEKKTDERLDELLKGCNSAEEILGKHGLLKQLTQRLVERALEAELTEHLGYQPPAREGRGSGNSPVTASARSGFKARRGRLKLRCCASAMGILSRRE